MGSGRGGGGARKRGSMPEAVPPARHTFDTPEGPPLSHRMFMLRPPETGAPGLLKTNGTAAGARKPQGVGVVGALCRVAVPVQWPTEADDDVSPAPRAHPWRPSGHVWPPQAPAPEALGHFGGMEKDMGGQSTGYH